MVQGEDFTGEHATVEETIWRLSQNDIEALFHSLWKLQAETLMESAQPSPQPMLPLAAMHRPTVVVQVDNQRVKFLVGSSFYYTVSRSDVEAWLSKTER